MKQNMVEQFVALDVETANADLGSICQVGIVAFEGGQEVASWSSLVDPEDEFDGMNVYVHGITEEAVRGAPRLPDVADELRQHLEDRVVVTHTPFDRGAISRAHGRYEIPTWEALWLDSARVARRAWTQFARRGYGLANLCAHCGIEFQHHDAEEDARAAGRILVRAIEETGIGLEEWLKRSRQPIGSREHSQIRRDGDPDGPLAGEVLVFTGALSMNRREAADVAARAGCEVRPSVVKKTTTLVVGDQDVRKLHGKEKSSKHRKAEQLIEKGHQIRIIGESDFLALVDLE